MYYDENMRYKFLRHFSLYLKKELFLSNCYIDRN